MAFVPLARMLESEPFTKLDGDNRKAAVRRWMSLADTLGRQKEGDAWDPVRFQAQMRPMLARYGLEDALSVGTDQTGTTALTAEIPAPPPAVLADALGGQAAAAPAAAPDRKAGIAQQVQQAQAAADASQEAGMGILDRAGRVVDTLAVNTEAMNPALALGVQRTAQGLYSPFAKAMNGYWDLASWVSGADFSARKADPERDLAQLGKLVYSVLGGTRAKSGGGMEIKDPRAALADIAPQRQAMTTGQDILTSIGQGEIGRAAEETGLKVAASMPTMAVAMGLTASGAPQAGLALFGLTSAGDKAAELADRKDLSEDQKRAVETAYGGAEIWGEHFMGELKQLEKLLGGRFLGLTLRDAAKELMKQGAKGAGEEAGTQALQSLVDFGYELTPEKTLGDYLRDVGNAAIVGAVMEGGMGAVTLGTDYALRPTINDKMKFVDGLMADPGRFLARFHVTDPTLQQVTLAGINATLAGDAARQEAVLAVLDQDQVNPEAKPAAWLIREIEQTMPPLAGRNAAPGAGATTESETPAATEPGTAGTVAEYLGSLADGSGQPTPKQEWAKAYAAWVEAGSKGKEPAGKLSDNVKRGVRKELAIRQAAPAGTVGGTGKDNAGRPGTGAMAAPGTGEPGSRPAAAPLAVVPGAAPAAGTPNVPALFTELPPQQQAEADKPQVLEKLKAEKGWRASSHTDVEIDGRKYRVTYSPAIGAATIAKRDGSGTFLTVKDSELAPTPAPAPRRPQGTETNGPALSLETQHAQQAEIPAQFPGQEKIAKEVTPAVQAKTKELQQSMPGFQGNKRDMLGWVLQSIRNVFSPADLLSFRTAEDWFGGGGNWGISLALGTAPNVKLVRVHEFNAARAAKIRYFHERGNLFMQDFNASPVKALLQQAIDTAEDNGTESASAIARRLEALKTPDITEQDQALMQALIDYCQNSYGKKEDASADIPRLTANDAGNAHAAAAQFRLRGGRIEVVAGDSYSAPVQDDPQTLSIVDPPYLFTKGYNGQTLVGVDTYRQTADMLRRLAAAGHSIVYTDSVWWTDATRPDLPQNLKQDYIEASYVLRDQILKTLNHAAALDETIGKDRKEILGVHRNERIGTEAKRTSEDAAGSPVRQAQPGGEAERRVSAAGGVQTGEPGTSPVLAAGSAAETVPVRNGVDRPGSDRSRADVTPPPPAPTKIPLKNIHAAKTTNPARVPHLIPRNSFNKAHTNPMQFVLDRILEEGGIQHEGDAESAEIPVAYRASKGRGHSADQWVQIIAEETGLLRPDASPADLFKLVNDAIAGKKSAIPTDIAADPTDAELADLERELDARQAAGEDTAAPPPDEVPFRTEQRPAATPVPRATSVVLGARAVEKILEPLRQAYPGVTFKVLSGIFDPAIPAKVLRAVIVEARRTGNRPTFKGVMYEGTVYIMAPEHSSRQDVLETGLHEAVGHLGLQPLLKHTDPAAWGRVVEIVANPRSPGFLEFADFAAAQSYDLGDDAQRSVAVEEWIATRAQDRATPGWLTRVRGIIRQALRLLFGENYNPRASFIDELLDAADRRMRKQKAGDGKTGPARFLMAGAKANTAGNTARAEDMERQGATREEIWQSTGWYRGTDGKWRFELDDSQMAWKGPKTYQAARKLHDAESPTFYIDEVLDVPATVKKAYPGFFDRNNGMQRLAVSLTTRLAPGSAQLSLHNIDIGVPRSGEINAKEATATIAHEIQHAIQDREGFARGGDETTTTINAGQKVKELLSRSRTLLKQAAQIYQVPTGFTGEGETGSVYVNGYGPAFKQLPPEQQAEFRRLRREAYGLRSQAGAERRMQGEKNYWLLAGEAEARVAQQRILMTPEQRRQEPPWVTMEKMLRDEGVLHPGKKPEDVLIQRGADPAFRPAALRQTDPAKLRIEIENTPAAAAIVRRYENSIRAGQPVAPVFVDLNDPRRIVDGNHRAQAYKNLQMTVPTLVVDRLDAMQRLAAPGATPESVTAELSGPPPAPERQPTSTSVDAEYLAAVEAGDMETAQRLVDEAAKKAGYTIGPVWHGTTAPAFAEFSPDKIGSNYGRKPQDKGYWFSFDQAQAKVYATDNPDTRSQARTVRAFLRLQNPAQWGDTPANRPLLGGAVSRAIQAGHDGVIFHGLEDGTGIRADQALVFSPEQIKSADPITRDDAGNVIPLSQRFSQATPDIRFRPPKNRQERPARLRSETEAPIAAQDAEYLAAVERGDLDTAQRLVDEAAKKAGYNIGPLWHGTDAKFNAFNPEEIGSANDPGWLGRGFYFTNHRATAKQYGNKLVRAYLRIENPFVFMIENGKPSRSTAAALRNFNIKTDVARNMESADNETVTVAEPAKATETLIKNGFDGVLLQNGKYQETVVFNPSQIKSADPVTRDDAGNVIPLSQRFSQATPDIRFRPAAVQVEQTTDKNYPFKAYGPDGVLLYEGRDREWVQRRAAEELAANTPWTPEAGGVLYHGTTAAPFETFFDRLTYLAPNPQEATPYAMGMPGSNLTVSASHKPRIVQAQAAPGKALDIGAEVDRALAAGNDIDPVLQRQARKARREGYSYLTFTHPGMTDEDFRAVVSLYPARDLQVKRQYTAYKDMPAEIRFRHAAWHGSPHPKFERFSTQKIGSVEGNQSFGWGMYFTDTKAVAEYYRATLTGGFKLSVLIDGEIPRNRMVKGNATPLDKAAWLFSNDLNAGNVQSLDEYIRVLRSGDVPGWGDINDEARKMADLLEQNQHRITIKQNMGSTYQVELAPDKEEYLDWETPLSRQSKKVQDGLRQAFIQRGMPLDENGTPAAFARDPEGREMYTWLHGMGDAKSASLLLLANGIPGIRYPDGFSRWPTITRSGGKWVAFLNSDQGTPFDTREEAEAFVKDKQSYNYVIFDDRHVAIKAAFRPASSARPTPIGPEDIATTLDHTYIRDEKWTLEFLYDNQDKPWFTELLAKMNSIQDQVHSLMKGAPYDTNNVKERLLTSNAMLEGNPDDVWPIPVYVAADGQRDTIGLQLHQDGKLEMFEGNDEATPATMDLVNKLLGIGDQPVRVWTSQPAAIAAQIREGNVPAGIYVSPKRDYAASYWGEGRELVSVRLPMNRLSQESDVDWKVRPEQDTAPERQPANTPVFRPAVNPKTYKDITETDFGKGWLIRANGEMVDVASEFGGGTNDHVGFITALEHPEEYGVDPELAKRIIATIDDGTMETEDIVTLWQQVQATGTIRVRQFDPRSVAIDGVHEIDQVQEFVRQQKIPKVDEYHIEPADVMQNPLKVTYDELMSARSYRQLDRDTSVRFRPAAIRGTIGERQQVLGKLTQGLEVEAHVAGQDKTHSDMKWDSANHRHWMSKHWRYNPDNGVLYSWSALTPTERRTVIDFIKKTYQATPAEYRDPGIAGGIAAARFRPALDTFRQKLQDEGRGRPDLNQLVTYDDLKAAYVVPVDDARNAAGQPSRESHQQWEEWADAQIKEKGADALWQDLLAGRLDLAQQGGPTKLARKLLNLKTAKNRVNRDPAQAREITAAVAQIRSTRSAGARALAAGRDVNETDTDAARRSIHEAVFAPSTAEQKQLDDPDTTPEQKAKIIERAAKKSAGLVEKLMAAGYDVTNLDEATLNDPYQVAEIHRIITAARATVPDMLTEWWYNAILSAPPTHIANVTGNAVNIGYEYTFRRWAQASMAGVTGTAGAPSAGELVWMYRHIIPGMRAAGVNAVMAWNTEQAILGGTKKEDPLGGIDVAIPGDFGRFSRIPSRSLLAEDEVAKAFVFTVERAALAYRAARARNGKRSGEEIAAAAMDILNGADAELLADITDQAKKKARELTFQERQAWAVTGWLSQVRETPYFGKAFSFVFPFVRTPWNILRTGTRISPIFGELRMAKEASQGRYSGSKGKTRLVADVSERLLVWAAVAALSMLVGDDDEPESVFITGSRAPSTSKGKLEAQRKFLPPTSIRIGDTWYSYARIEPVATALAISVDTIAAARHPDQAAQIIWNAGLGALRDKTFLQGVGDIIRATEQGYSASGKGAAWLQNFAASWMPNIVRQALRAADPEIRDYRIRSEGLDALADFGERTLQKTLPLPALQPAVRRDWWGRPITKPEGISPATDWLWRMLTPAPEQDAATMNNVDRLIWNWNRKAEDRGLETYWPGWPDNQWRSRNGEMHRMSDEDYDRFLARRGQIAADLILRRNWKPNEPDLDQIHRIRGLFLRATRNAERELFGAVPVGD